MTEARHPTKRYGKTLEVDQPVPLRPKTTGIHLGTNRCPGGHRGDVVRPDVHPVAPGDAAVSVPAGAKAGDLTMHACTDTTEQCAMPADCGTLVVPENRAEPESRLIALPVIRILARSSHPLAPIFHLNGGPGITNMTFPRADRLTAEHDVVMVGYRGVDGSSVLNCPEVTAALNNSADYLGKASLSAYSEAFAGCAKRLERSGVDLAGYTLAEQADDINAARVALGYKRIDLLSESAGTRLGMTYQWRYPNTVERSVMVGVNPPGNFLYSGAEIDQGIEAYSALCAKQPSCRARTGNLAASMKHTAADMPSSWLSLPIKPGNVLVGTFLGLTFSTAVATELSGPMTLDSWISAAQGDPSGLWFLSLMAHLVLPQSFVWGEFASIGMADTHPVERYYSSGADRGSIIGNPLADFIWGAGGLVHAWPANPGENQYTSVQNSSVPTLLIGGTLDFETPAQNATKELLPHLSNGHQVILSGLGHVDDFWYLRAERQHAAADHVLRHRPGRHVPLHPERGQLHHSPIADRDCQGPPWGNGRLRLVGSDLARGVGDPDPPPGRYRPQDGRMDPFGRSDRVRTRRMVPRRTVGTAVLAEPAARRPAADSLGRGADLARGLRRLGPHRHAEGDAGQGHRCRRCRCGGRSRTRFPRDQRAYGVDHGDHRCGGRVEPEPARARHLDRAGRLPGNGRSGAGSVGDGAPAVDLSQTKHLEPALHLSPAGRAATNG